MIENVSDLYLLFGRSISKITLLQLKNRTRQGNARELTVSEKKRIGSVFFFFSSSDNWTSELVYIIFMCHLFNAL